MDRECNSIVTVSIWIYFAIKNRFNVSQLFPKSIKRQVFFHISIRDAREIGEIMQIKRIIYWAWHLMGC